MVESLSIVVDPVKRELRHTPERLWRLWAATQALRHRRHVRSGDLGVWLGHATNMMRLRMPLMPILQELYHRMDVRRERRVQIDYVFRREMWAARSLVFLATVVLEQPLSEVVHVSDSSTEGCGLLYRRARAGAMLDEMKYRERWRFMETEPEAERVFVSTTMARDLAWGFAGDEEDRVGDKQVFADPEVRGQVAGPPAGADAAHARWARAAAGAGKAPSAPQATPAERRGGGGAGCYTSGLEGSGREVRVDARDAREVGLAGGAHQCEGSADSSGRGSTLCPQSPPSKTERITLGGQYGDLLLF